MNDGYLRVTAMEPTQGRQVAIDLFFRSLATVHRERAVAVVLSGAGADGAVGLARIKEEGGLTLVQRPSDADCARAPAMTSATTSAPPCCAASSGDCRCTACVTCRPIAPCCKASPRKPTPCCATC